MNLITELPLLLAQADYNEQPSAAAGIIGAIFGLLFYGAIYIFVSFCLMKIYKKAGRPETWQAFIPIWNFWILSELSGKPGWWAIMLLIPCVNIVFIIMIMIALAQAFGKGAGFAIGLILLGIIFLPILAFGDSRYQGAAGAPPLPPV
jgi:hypothetical protein